MVLKRMFVVITAIFAVFGAYADNTSVTSKKYVDDFMTGYQDKVSGLGANKLMIYDNSDDGIGTKDIATSLGSNTSADSVPTVGAIKDGLDDKQDTITGTAGYVMTGTGNAGSVGERAIYSTSLYGDSLVTPQTLSSALVTAETVNNGVINAVNNSLRRVNENGDLDSNGTLWQISDDITALGICSDYAPATGTVVQNGTPTPTNPVMPNFYEQGNMILRAVGTYADSYDATTNKITRRVGVKVLDGTESWIYDASYSRFIINVPDLPIASPRNLLLISTHYQVNYNITKDPGYIYNGTGSSSNRPLMITDAHTSVESWTQWLAAQYAAGTPVVIYYPLATPVEESMPPRCQ